MVTLRKAALLAIATLLVIAACGGEPAGPPIEILTKEGIRFKAVSIKGDDDVLVAVELLNTTDSERLISYGGCNGFRIRLYRAGVVVLDSQPANGACDNWGASAAVAPRSAFVYKDSLFVGTTLARGRYKTVVLFNGGIDGARSDVAVSAGTVDL